LASLKADHGLSSAKPTIGQQLAFGTLFIEACSVKTARYLTFARKNRKQTLLQPNNLSTHQVAPALDRFACGGQQGANCGQRIAGETTVKKIVG
jgi:hypothetical protein